MSVQFAECGGWLQDVGFRGMPVTGRASHGGSGSMKGTRRSTSTNVRSTLQSLGRRSTGRCAACVVIQTGL